MSVHSTDGNTWQTKLKRIGELSATNRDMVFNNLGHLITKGMLKGLYQTLDSKKASGIDRVTKEIYGENLDENVNALIERIRKGTYRPKAVRMVEIPKDNGDKRPLAISCFEDKLVQLAASSILSSIYEPLFLSSSFGFRPSLSCHDALRALNQHTIRNLDGACIEIDIRKCFNTIPHKIIEEFLKRKISDKSFIRLITNLMRPNICKGKTLMKSEIGCPQGSILSPILANIFLHHVIDEWFDELKQTHFKGYAEEVRYADDMAFVFGNRQEADRFFKALPKRLQKYGLELSEDKSHLLPCGHLAAARAHSEGKRLPTFNFLGFTCYWGKSRKGFWRLKYKSRRDRFTEKLKGLRKYLWDNLTTKNTQELFIKVIRVIRGWVNYHAISDNQKCVNGFLDLVKRTIMQWFKRRGSKRTLSWKQLVQMLKRLGFPFKWKIVSMFPPPK